MGLPYVKTAKDLSGKIFFNNGGLKADNLSFLVFDQKIDAAGIMQDFKNPLLDIKLASAGVNISKLQEIFPKVFEEKKKCLQQS